MQKFQIDAETWATLNRLLDEALEQPAAELDRMARRAGAGVRRAQAAAARAAVAHRRWSRPANSCTRCRSSSSTPGDLRSRAARAEQPGDEIGPYRLVRELGSGGMGVVWLAERTDGLINRPVALKLPHGAWKRAGLAERMAREREILATLTHPNIAHLYDAGVTADGQPYLAIEYVEGRAHRCVLPRAAARRARAAAAVRAGGQRRRIRARQARRASRSEAREHPGHRRRPGAAARFRHRQAAGRRPGDARRGSPSSPAAR